MSLPLPLTDGLPAAGPSLQRAGNQRAINGFIMGHHVAWERGSVKREGGREGGREGVRACAAAINTAVVGNADGL